jgi:hypothetical protein
MLSTCIYLDDVRQLLDLRRVYSPKVNHENDTNESIDDVDRVYRVEDDLSVLYSRMMTHLFASEAIFLLEICTIL